MHTQRIREDVSSKLGTAFGGNDNSKRKRGKPAKKKRNGAEEYSASKPYLRMTDFWRRSGDIYFAYKIAQVRKSGIPGDVPLVDVMST